MPIISSREAKYFSACRSHSCAARVESLPFGSNERRPPSACSAEFCCCMSCMAIIQSGGCREVAELFTGIVAPSAGDAREAFAWLSCGGGSC